ncbi:GNAT family N-acetyltransferase [Aureimonas populi]|uniref:GNAT family N-acetyltransferase n=1 Tax=Aureimonas populi TaxID=1701758 RepID=A0ABW5CS54_9HYPH|nr:GNAT family N-acetyltransferase [Aureimonas populi]
MTEPLIRAAERSDAPALARLFNQPSYRHGTMRLPFETQEMVEKRLFDRAGDTTLLLVAELDGAVLGSAGLTRWTGRRSHVGLLGIGVDEAHRRRGIGRALMAALIDTADNWFGLRRIELEVNVDNEAAIALYTSLGFEIEGRERQAILRDGVLVDSFRMARLKDAPPPAGDD